MKKKSIISLLFVFAGALFLSAATNNEKALELMKKGNEAFKVYKNTSQAFSYYKQAADLASGQVKVDALLRTAYMSHLQGNKIGAYQDFIKAALKIDPNKKLAAADYKSSFSQIFNDIKSRGNSLPKPAAAKPAINKEEKKPIRKQVPLKRNSVKQSKYFICVSYAMGMAGSDQNQSWSEPLYGENSEYNLTDKMGKSSNIQIGFGYNLTKAMGIGLGAIIRSSDIDATVNASVPSPWQFDSPRSASATYAATLKATIFYLNFIYKLPFSKFSLDLFAGPAYFNSSTDVISAINIQDVFPNDVVTLSPVSENVKKSSFGFNAGLDLSYFFSSHLGVFVEGRYLSGSGTFSSSSQTIPGVKFNVGGLNVGAGLVFQF
jgi:opacity protein-like surface antigen